MNPNVNRFIRTFLILYKIAVCCKRSHQLRMLYKFEQK
nr:MAG TPA: hypothetical protein [Caudoviricetes sp.]